MQKCITCGLYARKCGYTSALYRLQFKLNCSTASSFIQQAYWAGQSAARPPNKTEDGHSFNYHQRKQPLRAFCHQNFPIYFPSRFASLPAQHRSHWASCFRNSYNIHLYSDQQLVQCHFSRSAVFVLMQIEGELRNICSDVLDVLSKHLLPAATMAEAKVFYSKMYVAHVSASSYQTYFCCASLPV